MMENEDLLAGGRTVEGAVLLRWLSGMLDDDVDTWSTSAPMTAADLAAALVRRPPPVPRPYARFGTDPSHGAVGAFARWLEASAVGRWWRASRVELTRPELEALARAEVELAGQGPMEASNVGAWQLELELFDSAVDAAETRADEQGLQWEPDMDPITALSKADVAFVSLSDGTVALWR